MGGSHVRMGDHTTICEVLRGQLYLTGAEGASDAEQIERYGIRRVVNLSGAPNAFPMARVDEDHGTAEWYGADIDYLRIELRDESGADIGAQFEATQVYITKAVSEKVPVLVHCMMGCSRAATIVIAYLIAERQMSLRDAYLHVQACRPIIEPNPGFW